MRDQFISTLSNLAAQDERVVLLTADLGFGVLTAFQKRFPKQFFNVGVAEQNMTGLATGMAMDGHIVFTYSIGNFCTLRCLEQIRNDAAYHEANVNIVSIGGGFSYGALGYSHHATEDLSILRSLPNVVSTAPCDLWEVDEVTRAVTHQSGVSYLRLDKSVAPVTHDASTAFEFGKARVVRQGTDVTLIAMGGILEEALLAGEKLAEHGIYARVIAVHSINPLDVETLKRAALETGGVITIEEHTIRGGLGSALAEEFLEQGVHPKFFYRIGLRAGFSTIVGSQKYLRKQYQMDWQSIVLRAIELLNPPIATLTTLENKMQGGHK